VFKVQMFKVQGHIAYTSNNFKLWTIVREPSKLRINHNNHL